MMLIRRILFLITLLFMAGSLSLNTAAAAPPKQAPEGQEYIIQAGDTLSILADRFLGDTSRYFGFSTNCRGNQCQSRRR
jgi:hypothetical protein